MSKKTNAQLIAEIATLQAQLAQQSELIEKFRNTIDEGNQALNFVGDDFGRTLYALGLKTSCSMQEILDHISKTKEEIFVPEESRDAVLKTLATQLSQNAQMGSLGARGCILADLTQRSWRATTVAQIHMVVRDNQLVISIDRDLYLADKAKWMYAFGMIRGALEGSCLQYNYNNGQQIISLKKENRQAA